MTKLKHILAVSFLVASLAACSGNKVSSTSPDQVDQYIYYSQTTPVRAQSVVNSIDPNRYSAMHVTQSSYLFK